MNGCLDPTELREAIDTVLQLTLNEDEFNKILSSMETNSDGAVTLKKFKKYFKSVKTIQWYDWGVYIKIGCSVIFMRH